MPLIDPLEEGQVLSVTDSSGRQIESQVLGPAVSRSCTAAATPSPDQRSSFLATFSAGFLSETFAPKKRALQEQFAAAGKTAVVDDGTTTFARADSVTTIVDIAYRLPLRAMQHRPVWVMVTGLYGRRTGVCIDGDACGDGIPSANEALVNVRRAETAEVYIGGRWEFLPLATDSINPSAVYVACQSGSIFIEKVGDKALSSHFCGFGLSLIGGRYRESFIQVGTGTSEIFAPDHSRWNRKKVDALITSRVVNRDVANRGLNLLNSFRPYFRLSLDRGTGPDSLQSSWGFIFDMVNVFGSPN